MRRPKTILKIRKKATLLEVIKKPIIGKIFKDCGDYRHKLTGQQFLVLDLIPALLNIWTTNGIFLKSTEQASLRHILKSSPSKYERSGLQFFRITTGKQSEPIPTWTYSKNSAATPEAPNVMISSHVTSIK